MLDSVKDRIPFSARFGIVNLYLHTEQGLPLFDKLARDKKWDTWHDLGIASLVLSMVGFLAFILVSAAAILLADPAPSSASDPKNLLAVPGVNEFIPLAHTGAFLAALLLAMIVHEGGHALAMRRAGVEIKEWGVVLLLGILPIGAYVEPNEEELNAQPVRDFSRILSAGVMNNYAITVLTAGYFLLVPGTPGVLEVFVLHLEIIYGGDAFFALGAVTTFVYWMLFINFNLALVNTLPISILDGGRVYGKYINEKLNESHSISLPVVGSTSTQKVIRWSTSISAIALFCLMAFGARL